MPILPQEKITNFSNILNQIKNISDEDLEKIIEQARKIGISENQIQQGLQLIKMLKNR